MKRAASSLLGLLLVIGLASPVSAQYVPKSGDFLVTGASAGRGYLFAADPTKSGQVQPVYFYNAVTGLPMSVGMLEDNRGMGVLTQVTGTPPGGRLLRHEPAPYGPASTLASFAMPASTPPGAFCWDGDGDLLISAGRYLLIMDPEKPGTLTTFFAFHPATTAVLGPMARVPVSNYGTVVVNWGTPAPYVFGVDHNGTLARTLNSTTLRTATWLSYDYALGAAASNMFVSWQNGITGAVLRMNAVSGSYNTLTTLNMAPIAHRYTQRDTLLVLGHNSVVQEIDRQGRVFWTLGLNLGSGFVPTGFDVYGSNCLHVSLEKKTVPGTMVFDLNDPAAANLYYLFAISFDSKATRIDKGRLVNLAIDTLFLLSATNVLNTVIVGGQGQLDANGHARATIKRPASAWPWQNLQFYAAWVSYDKSGVFSVSETEHFVLP
jgi:hypothetical protein